MLSRLKFTARSTIIYAVGTISVKMIGLILLPIYTDKLSTDQYGMWSLLEITSQMLLMIIGFRMSTGMIRFYASSKDAFEKAKIIFTTIWVTVGSVVVFVVICFPFTEQFSSFFFDTPEYKTYFSYLIIWASLEIFNKILLDLIRINEKPGFFILISIIKFTVVLLIIIYLIVYRDHGISGILIGQICGSALVLLISLPFIVKRMVWVFDFDLFRQMFRYSYPLIFSGIASFLLVVGDKYMIKIFLDYSDVGLYSLSYKFSNLLKMVFVQAFQLGFLPIAFNMYDKENSKRFFSKVFTYYTFILFWTGLAVSLFSKEIIYTFASNPDYFEAYKYVPLQTLAICFFGIQSFFIIGMHYAKETSKIAIINTIVLAVSISLNWILIPRLGLYGAAIVYIFSSLLLGFLLLLQSQKYYYIPYEFKKAGMLFLLAILLYSVTFFIQDTSLALRIIIKLLLLIAFPLVLYFFNFYERIEIEIIVKAWKTWRNPVSWKANIKRLIGERASDDSNM